MRFIDLSHDITHGMPVFPGDPAVGILRHQYYENGYFVSQVILGTHTGTHVDVPAHRIRGGRTVDDVPIERFAGRAYVMDFTMLKPLEEITRAHLDALAEKVEGVNAVIIKTGWSAHFGKDDFYTAFPGLSEEAAAWFKEKGVNLIGLESPSVNVPRHEAIHALLLGSDICIVESLANVGEIKKEYVQFYAAPLKLRGLDGAPARAFAVEE